VVGSGFSRRLDSGSGWDEFCALNLVGWWGEGSKARAFALALKSAGYSLVSSLSISWLSLFDFLADFGRRLRRGDRDRA